MHGHMNIPYVIYEKKVTERYYFPLCVLFMRCVQKTLETCGRTSPFILRPFHADCLGVCVIYMCQLTRQESLQSLYFELKGAMKFSSLPTPSQKYLIYNSEMPKAGNFF